MNVADRLSVLSDRFLADAISTTELLGELNNLIGGSRDGNLKSALLGAIEAINTYSAPRKWQKFGSRADAKDRVNREIQRAVMAFKVSNPGP